MSKKSNEPERKVTDRGNGVTEQSNGAKTTKDKLTGKTNDIINFCTVPRTAGEILARMGLTNQTKKQKEISLFTCILLKTMVKFTCQVKSFCSYCLCAKSRRRQHRQYKMLGGREFV